MVIPTDQPMHDAGFRRRGCTCAYCRGVAAAYARRTRRLRAYGRWAGWQPAEPVRAHLQTLTQAGTNLRQIHRQTGISIEAIRRVRNGRCTRLTARVSAALLAAYPEPQWVAQVGIRRRAQALARMGYTIGIQAQMLGILASNYYDICSKQGRSRQWPRWKAQAQAELYDRLAFAPVPTGWKAEWCRRRATQWGWASPAAWWDGDTDTIDDPKAKPASITPAQRKRPSRSLDPDPDWEAVDKVLAGTGRWSTLNTADRAALVGQLLGNDWAPTRIAHHFGLSGTTITALVERVTEAAA
jgi:hypothetical protein